MHTHSTRAWFRACEEDDGTGLTLIPLAPANRPLSKTVRFNVLKVIPMGSKVGSKQFASF